MLSNLGIACWREQLPLWWVKPSTKDSAHWLIILLITACREYNPICLSQSTHYSRLASFFSIFLLWLTYICLKLLVSSVWHLLFQHTSVSVWPRHWLFFHLKTIEKLSKGWVTFWQGHFQVKEQKFSFLCLLGEFVYLGHHLSLFEWGPVVTHSLSLYSHLSVPGSICFFILATFPERP